MAELSLRVGETAAVRRRWWGKSWSLTYAGMLRDGTVSVAVSWAIGHASAAYNLFLAPEQRQFRLAVGDAEILELSPARIRLRFDRAGPL